MAENAERDHENGGPQIGPPQHLGHRASHGSPGFAKGVGDVGQLLFDAGLGLHSQQGPTSVGDPALEHVPASGFRHANQQRQQECGEYGGQPEDPAPAVRVGKQVTGQVAEDDAADYC